MIWVLSACEEPRAGPAWLLEAEHRFYTEDLRLAEQQPFAWLLLPLRGVTELSDPRVERVWYDQEAWSWRFEGRGWSCVQLGGSGGSVYWFTVEGLRVDVATWSASSSLVGASLPERREGLAELVIGAFWRQDMRRDEAQIHGAFRRKLDQQLGLPWRHVWTPGRPRPLVDELFVRDEADGTETIYVFNGGNFEEPAHVCSLGSLELYRTGDALAVYDPALDASSWVMVAEGEYKAPTLTEVWCEGERVGLIRSGERRALEPRSGREQRLLEE